MATVANSESEILSRIVVPDVPAFDVPLARAMLSLRFREEDSDRMDLLAAKARKGSLTPSEREEVGNFERVGHLLSLLHSKARAALRGSTGESAS